MKKELETMLRGYFKQGLSVAKRECLFNLPPELDAYVAICSVDKEKIFREATLQHIKGDDMIYTTVLQELVDDIRFNIDATYERKQALLKLREAHMWLKAVANKNNKDELDLTQAPNTNGGNANV